MATSISNDRWARAPNGDAPLLRANRALHARGYPALWNIDCEIVDAVLVLRGVVPSYYLAQAAQEAVRHIPGIRRVRNALEVHPAQSILNGSREHLSRRGEAQ